MSNADRDVIAIKSRLGELAQRFVTRTSGDVALMREALARVEAGDASALEEIRQLAHRACGTGGTLGLLALSDAAGALEHLVDHCLAGDPPDAGVRAEIAARIEAMATALR